MLQQWGRGLLTQGEREGAAKELLMEEVRSASTQGRMYFVVPEPAHGKALVFLHRYDVVLGGVWWCSEASMAS
jgi:hypothetical protein